MSDNNEQSFGVTEKIFGGVLVLAIIATGAYILAKNGLPVFSSGIGKTAALTDEVNPAIFTGDFKEDMCTCYELGFSRGLKFTDASAEGGATIDETPAFKIGYSACRSAAGLEGGSAWSEGWGNGVDKRKTQRKCTFYLKSNRIK